MMLDLSLQSTGFEALPSKTWLVRQKRALEAQQGELQTRMEALAAMSLDLHQIGYLALFSKPETGSMALRWRNIAHRYLTDEALLELLQRLVPQQREPYLALHRQARALNLMEGAVRSNLAITHKLLALHEESAYA